MLIIPAIDIKDGRAVRLEQGDMNKETVFSNDPAAVASHWLELGGGISDLDTVERYLDDGISYVIIGTAAVKNPGFMQDACTAFTGHIIVGLDAKDGKVA